MDLLKKGKFSRGWRVRFKSCTLHYDVFLLCPVAGRDDGRRTGVPEMDSEWIQRTARKGKNVFLRGERGGKKRPSGKIGNRNQSLDSEESRPGTDGKLG